MDSRSYAAFLRRAYAQTEAQRDLQRTTNAKWLRLRAEQVGEPELVQHLAGLVDLDPSEALTDLVCNHLLPPLKAALPANFGSRLDEIPFVVLPIRSVNACVAKAPNGDPVVIIDAGLFAMCDFFVEVTSSVSLIADTKGWPSAQEHLITSYRFIVDYYKNPSQSPYPEPHVPMPSRRRNVGLSITLGVETFVLGHEIAHIYSGHLDSAPIKKVDLIDAGNVDASVCQLSWEKEYAADSLAWDWYQLARSSSPHLTDAGGKIAPLHLFQYMCLIDRNIPSHRDRFSSHPPSALRLAALLRKVAAANDAKVFLLAHFAAEAALNMPQLDMVDGAGTQTALDAASKLHDAVRAGSVSSISIQADLAATYATRAMDKMEEEDPVGARADFDIAIELREAIRTAEGPNWSVPLRDGLAQTYELRALALMQTGSLDGARGDLRTAIGLLGATPVAQVLPDHAALQNNLATLCHNRAIEQAERGDLEGAKADLGAAIELREELRITQGSEWPERLRTALAQTYETRAGARMQSGDLAGAQIDVDSATGLLEAVPSTQRPEKLAPLRMRLARAYGERALEKVGDRDLTGARADLDTAITLQEAVTTVLGSACPVAFHDDLATTYENRAITKKKEQDLVGARVDYNAAIQVIKRTHSQRTDQGWRKAEVWIAELEKGKGDPETS